MELRFHEDLYDGFAIDEAAKVYAPYASIDLAREPGVWVVRLEKKPGAGDAGEGVIAAELMNYALGKTIERRGAP